MPAGLLIPVSSCDVPESILLMKFKIDACLLPEDTDRAREIQSLLALKVRLAPLEKSPGLVAAVDASFFNDTVVAVATLFTYPEMRHLQDAYFTGKTLFPYIPGYLSFREGPAVIEALLMLELLPDVVLFDAQGIAHPRGLGLASHAGIILGRPAIGCAKSRLMGNFREPGRERGSWSYIYPEGRPHRPIGAVVRTRSGVKPLFVSPGHLIDIESSVDIVMQCSTEYRIPEPLRRADMLSRMMKKRGGG
jgi:deoxyribonuclease V